MSINKKLLQLIQGLAVLAVVLMSLLGSSSIAQDVEKIEQQNSACIAELLDRIILYTLALSFAKGAIGKLKS